MSDSQIKLNPVETAFTVKDDEASRGKIIADMKTIAQCIIPRVSDIARPVALVLVGGFGRGEGSLMFRDGKPVPVNDYDFIVVVETVSLFVKRRLRRLLRRLSVELEREIHIAVDLDLRDANDLRRTPGTVAWYEVQCGHKIIWGEKGVFDAMPRIDSGNIDLWDGGFLLFNRSSGLLMAKKRLLDGGPKDERERIHFQIQLSKAAQAWGDCLLIMEGRYDLSYLRRMELAAEVDFSSVPQGGRVRAEYFAALEMKVRPNFTEVSRGDIEAMYESTLSVHEDFMRWFERRRLGGVFETWGEYASAKLVKLDMPPQPSSRLRNLVKNLLAFGFPAGCGDVSRYSRPVIERLACVTPLLLFEKEAGDVALAAKILHIKDIPSGDSPEILSMIIARHLSLWH